MGYVWENLGDDTIGMPKKPVLPTWDSLKNYTYPNPRNRQRLNGIEEYKNQAGDRYRLACFEITGFTTYAFLRGMENAFMDFMVEKEQACYLLDKIVEFENGLAEFAGQQDFDGIYFADDWGTQEGLIISPELWRELFKPRYKKQFDFIHELGMHVWFHCCGNITAIIPDFHEIGVDVMNISQPNAVDIPAISKQLKDKQCFMVPISYQTIGISTRPTAAWISFMQKL